MHLHKQKIRTDKDVRGLGRTRSWRTYFHSLKFELTVLFFGIVAAAIVIIMLANRFLLERYYYRAKQTALEETYQSLDAAAQADAISSDSFGRVLNQIGNENNINILVIDEESKTVRSFTTDLSTMMRRMWDNILENTNDVPEDFNEEQVRQWTSDENAPQFYIVKRLTETDSRRVQIVLDQLTGTQYIEQWGMLSDGTYYLLRSAVDSIRLNSEIANRFVFYVGLFVIVVGAVAAFLVARSVTKPITRMTELSQQMSRLDFSAKYVSNGHQRNEIEILGDNMNELSDALEKAISELKEANAKLRQDIERRDKTEAMQREFISNVTHELKTPIALIQGYAEGLQDGMAEDPEDRDYYCSVITDEAKKMNHMVQQLLALTHLEFGQNNELNYQNFDIVELVNNYLSTAGMLAKDKDIQVQVKANGPVNVWADQFYVEEVFQNYYTNAVNHCEPAPDSSGGLNKVIEIRFRKKENSVRISVFNTGKPIPEESMPRIWEKFYKVDKARTREYGGSGVGLSIVKAIMDLLHQPYGAENFDNGVEFWFELETK